MHSSRCDIGSWLFKRTSSLCSSVGGLLHHGFLFCILHVGFSFCSCYCFLPCSSFAFADGLLQHWQLLLLLAFHFFLVLILAFVLMNSTDIVPCGCFQCLARTPISKFLSHTCPWIQSQFKINLVSSPFQY